MKFSTDHVKVSSKSNFIKNLKKYFPLVFNHCKENYEKIILRRDKPVRYNNVIVFFSGFFLLRKFVNHRTAGERDFLSLTPRYHFQPLHRQIEISRAITAESSYCTRNEVFHWISSFLQIWSHLLKKFLMENFISFCSDTASSQTWIENIWTEVANH